jgi:hypothetical protein
VPDEDEIPNPVLPLQIHPSLAKRASQDITVPDTVYTRFL